MNKLGVYTLCYDEVQAIHFAYNSLRAFYPDSPIYLNSESNLDFNFLKTYFKKIYIENVEDTQSGIFKFKPGDHVLNENRIKNKNAVINLISRLKKAFEFLQSDYVIMHCPDTLVRNKLTIPEGSVLLGSNVNNYFFEDVNNVISNYGGSPISNFGAVPAIFKVEKFLECLKIFESSNILDELCDVFYAVYSHDIIIPIIFALGGEIEQYNPDITECTRNPDWLRSKHPILHQFRSFYPKRKLKYGSE